MGHSDALNHMETSLNTWCQQHHIEMLTVVCTCNLYLHQFGSFSSWALYKTLQPTVSNPMVSGQFCKYIL